VADSIFEQIGELASPVAPALEFLGAPTQGGAGRGFSVGELFGALGAGVQTAAQNGPAALVAGAGQIVDTASGMSTRDRLLAGGLVLAGGALTARQAHQRWRADRLARGWRPAPAAGYADLNQLGDRARFVERASERGHEVALANPGINLKSAQILGADDYDEIVSAFGAWSPDDVAAPLHAKVLFDRYAQQLPEGAEAAQVDFARFTHAMDRGLFAYEGNADLRKLWSKFTTAPQSLTATEQDRLFGVLRQFGDATRLIESDDLSFGPVGKVERIDVTDAGVVLYTRHPTGWTDGSAIDPVVRTERINQLNYRALAGRGKDMLRRLYQIGMEDWTREEGVPPRLPGELEVGPEWYPTARQDVAKEFGLPDVDSDELERAVAAVSFLSEAEDWSTNIAKAHRVMNGMPAEVLDEDFQTWLRSGSVVDVRDPKLGRHQYAGTKAAEHEATFERIHQQFLLSGFKVSSSDLKKVVRLRGGFETVQDVFKTTQARKQKNFYLNIYRPGLEYPVTIDRHAFDAFLGIDSGIQDRPIDVTVGDGDQVYDVVADTYRSLADELGVLPHELQAVVWEAWRLLKRSSPKNGWSRNDPFMMPEADGSTNLIYEALNGRGLHTTPGSLADGGVSVLPLDVLEASDIGGLGAAALPDGNVAYLADATDEVSARFNHLYPAVEGADRVPRWANVRPDRVQSVATVRQIAAADAGSIGESWLNADLDTVGGHPLLSGRESITFEVPDGAYVKPPRGLEPRQVGRVEIDRPERSLERLSVDDLDPNTFQDPATSPMNTHAWAAISADLSEEQLVRLGMKSYSRTQARNALRAELQRRGYNPIDQVGIYDGGSEPSFLVFGITPAEALELGEKFGQDSVLTPDGFVYHRTAPNDPETAGQLRPTAGDIEFNIPDDADFRSRLTIGDQDVTWASPMDWDRTTPYEAPAVLKRTSSSARKFVVQVPPGKNLAELASDLERKGAKNVSIYARQAELEGWQRAREHLFTDGQQTYAVRSLDNDVTRPNSGNVFVRSTAGLGSAPELRTSPVDYGDGRVLLNSSVVFDGRALGPGSFKGPLSGAQAFGVTLEPPTITPLAEGVDPSSFAAVARPGKTVTIEAKPDDVLPAIEARNILRAAGVEDPIELRGETGRFGFVKPTKGDPPAGKVLLKNGFVVPRLRRDSPMPDWEADFGIEFDPGWRYQGRRQRLDDTVVADLRQVTELFFGQHADAARRWRLPRVTVSEFDRDAFAALEWKAGGSIVLTKYWWRDQARFVGQLTQNRAVGHLTPNAPNTPGSILAHEYGHVLHGALRLSEGMVQNSSIDRAIRDIGRRYGGPRTISDTAAIEPAEVVAEAYSEVVTGIPSAYALEVYDLVTSRLNDALRHRKLVGP
jgi:hypothetical protein